jgi:hypothetical protein
MKMFSNRQPIPAKRYVLTVCWLLSAFCPAVAQEFWTGLTLRTKLNKMVSVQAEQQFRFRETIGNYSSTFTEAGVRLRPWEHLGAAVYYRYTNRTGSGRADDNDRQRWSGEVSYTIGSDKTQWIFGHRIRYQNSGETGGENERKSYLRNRLMLVYNLTKRVQPYLSGETFYRFDGRDETQLNRFSMGLETRIGKNFTLDAFYRVEKERNVKYPQTAYIVGIAGTYRIAFRKKDSPDEGDGLPSSQ